MSVDRKPLKSLFNVSIGLREPFPNEPAEADILRRNDLVIYDRARGTLLGSVSQDELFDENGNHFFTE